MTEVFFHKYNKIVPNCCTKKERLVQRNNILYFDYAQKDAKQIPPRWMEISADCIPSK